MEKSEHYDGFVIFVMFSPLHYLPFYRLAHCLKIFKGPFRFGLNGHDIGRFIELRVRSIFHKSFSREEYPRQKAKGIGERVLASAKL